MRIEKVLTSFFYKFVEFFRVNALSALPNISQNLFEGRQVSSSQEFGEIKNFLLAFRW